MAELVAHLLAVLEDQGLNADSKEERLHKPLSLMFCAIWISAIFEGLLEPEKDVRHGF